MKVVTAAGTRSHPRRHDRRAHAGDTISEFVLAMRHGLGLRKILGTIHSYPTLAEANKFAAGRLAARAPAQAPARPRGAVSPLEARLIAASPGTGKGQGTAP